MTDSKDLQQNKLKSQEEIYNLDYQIREETKHFINNKLETIINNISNYDNGTDIFKSVKEETIYIKKEDGTEESSYNKQDIYFICDALFCIHQWFDTHENNKIYDNLQNVYFYKHELIGTKGETVFANLNSGRVALTDIELIKADLIINISEGKSNNDIKINELRRDIGRKWDEIENWFSKDEVWYWIAPKNKNTNKISLLFSLLLDSFKNTKNKKYIDMYELYSEYVFDFKSTNNIYKSIWKELDNYYRIITNLYKDNDLYHLVGISIVFGINLKQIIELYNTEIKDDLKNKLKIKIKDKLGIKNSSNYKLDIENIFNDKYYCKEHREYINNLFLLLNCLESFAENKFKEESRYRFDLHNKENWSIEHILPQKITKDNISLYIDDLRHYIEEDEDENLKSSFSVAYQEYISSRKIDNVAYIINQLGFMHQMGNLVLLDNSTNNSLKNKPFSKKRDEVRKARQDRFIPPLAYTVFSKFFENSEKDKNYWSPKDFYNYIIYQKKKLINFIDTIY